MQRCLHNRNPLERCLPESPNTARSLAQNCRASVQRSFQMKLLLHWTTRQDLPIQGSHPRWQEPEVSQHTRYAAAGLF